MDTSTGHITALKLDGYTPIPRHLQEDANAALNGKPEAYINLKDNTSLAKWADKKRKNKRKAVRQSRKANRK